VNGRGKKIGQKTRVAGALVVVAATLGLSIGVGIGLGGCGTKAPTGGVLEVVGAIGEVGDGAGQFSYPRCLDTDGETLWVIDKGARVQRLDTSGKCLTQWRMPELEKGKPTGVTVWREPGTTDDAGLWVFVPDTHYHRVMVYRPDGALVAAFGGYGEGDRQFIYLTDVAVEGDGAGGIAKLYVSEYGGNDRISVYGVDWAALKAARGLAAKVEPGPIDARFQDAGRAFAFERAFGKFGTGNGPEVEFNRPQAIVLDAKRGELIVADACNHRVGRVTTSGELLTWISSAAEAGKQPGQFRYPYCVSLLADGTAMVSEFGNNRVQRIELSTGASLGLFGTQGRKAGELATPWCVVEMGDNCWILDSGNNRLQAFATPKGRPATPLAMASVYVSGAVVSPGVGTLGHVNAPLMGTTNGDGGAK